MNKGVIDRDLGYRRIMADLRALDAMVVEVGLQDDGSGSGGITNAAKGMFNEYGTRHIPERSFMRSTFDETRGKLDDLTRRLVGGVEDGKIGPRQAGELLGAYHQKDIQRKIQSGIPPPNKAATAAAKGSTKTLIDTAAMLQAIRYVVKG